MSDDKTLLELAARAAGIEIEWERDDAFIQEVYRLVRPYNNQGLMTAVEWNPLRDSGDCHDLQVRLKISLEWWPSEEKWLACKWLTSESTIYECVEASDPDPKRAVLLVASELGKLMGGK